MMNSVAESEQEDCRWLLRLSVSDSTRLGVLVVAALRRHCVTFLSSSHPLHATSARLVKRPTLVQHSFVDPAAL
jgi:hypothetical protein